MRSLILLALLFSGVNIGLEAKELSKTELQKFIYDVIYDGGRKSPARYNNPIRVRILGDGSWMRGPEIESIVNKIAKSSQIDMSFTRGSNANFYIILANKLSEEIPTRYWPLMENFLIPGENRYSFYNLNDNCFGRIDKGEYETGQIEIIRTLLFVSDEIDLMKCLPLYILGNIGIEKIENYKYSEYCNKYFIAIKYIYSININSYQHIPEKPENIKINTSQEKNEVSCE